MMRLSQPFCTLCGKVTHVASDHLCARITIVQLALSPVIHTMKKIGGKSSICMPDNITVKKAIVSELVTRRKDAEIYRTGDHGRNQLEESWKQAMQVGLSPRPPCSTTQRKKAGGIVRKLSIATRIKEIRNAWPFDVRRRPRI